MSYYGQPMLKPPVWIWAVPVYLYVGGASGAAMILGAAAQFAGGREMVAFARRCRWVGGVGGGVGTALLIYDLGRPERFLNMLRVFRPSSPMSIGAWVLAGAAPVAMGSALMDSRALGYVAGALGLPLAGYTGVLLGNTAVPLWQQARRVLPILFCASAATAVASLFEMTELSRRERRLVFAFGTAGRAAELAAGIVLERVAHPVEQPLRRGVSGALWKSATALTAASLVVSLLPGGSRKRKVAGLLGTLGSIALRFAMHQAGRASALDPEAPLRMERAIPGD